jgi:photosystem II stability/assembly factor-like uncharacterized protein
MFTSALLAVLAVCAAPADERTKPPEKPEYVAPIQKKMVEQPFGDPFVADATLNDVCFIDAKNGWAVGDRGAIWHTADGGKTWQRQNSGVRATLGSVCFLDEKIGYAAGGYALPYSHRGVGVFLSTRDGGETWQFNPRLALPALKRIGFFDAAHGWAIATPSAMYSSGAFTTDDRGKTWKPLPGPGTPGWLTGIFFTPRAAALAGRNGTLGEVASGATDLPAEGVFGLRSIRQLRLGSQNLVWLVGDGGTVAATGNLTGTQRPAQAPLPEGVVENFDFAALSVRGPKIWVAGTPGSVVFHSSDAGRTWSAFPTGSPLPIQALTFADDEHGWAVGALGTILATADSGRTWQPQRSGGARAAILGLFAEAEGIPLELFAKISAQDGLLSVAESITRRDVEVAPPAEVPLADRMHQAVVEAGASDGITDWNFPLRQKGIQLTAAQIVEGWDRANAGRGLAALRAHLVRQIRMWRPELVVTQEVAPRTKDPLSQLVSQSVLQAVEDAADPAKYADQIQQAGLSPWRTKKIFAVTATGTHGAAELTTSQLASRLGDSFADIAAGPRGLIADHFTPTPATIGFRSLLGATGDAGRELPAGMGVQAAKDARRELLAPPAENLDTLHRAAIKRRNAQAIIELSSSNSLGASQLLAQADSLTAGLDEVSAGRIFFQMGDMYARAGRWAMAAETYQAFLQRYPNHPLTQVAMLWLMRYYTSAEAAWCERRAERIGRAESAAQNAAENVDANTAQQQIGNSEDRVSLATALGKEIERTRPDLFADPLLRFPLAAVERQAAARQTDQYYLVESRSPAQDAWSQCALGEIWLADRKQRSSRPMLACTRAAEKPKLDGVLDDAIWQKAKPVTLASAQHDDEEWPACVGFSYDAEFLYIAVTCKKKGEEDLRSESGDWRSKIGEAAGVGGTTRTRDGDLSAHDRVEILLDIDRDYATYYRFAVDHRGWTAESCFGDLNWNPDWFVAAKESDEVWTVEIAIPLEELVPATPKPRDAWAIGIQRTVPGLGFQSWTTPASTDILPQGFGYLIFD